MLLLQQMIVLFILMLIGFCARKKGMITPETSKKLSGIVVNIANPALILSGSINRSEPIQLRELGMMMGIAVALFAGLILVSLVVVPLLRVPKESAGTYRAMTIFSNIGFMGFPVIEAIYGSDALLYASLFLIPYNLLIYTYGIAAMKKPGDKKEKGNWKNVLNMGVISCILAILISITQISLPKFIGSSVSSLSNLTAPLSMMVIGASIVDMDLKAIVRDVRLLIFAVIKQLAIPVAGMFIIQMFLKDAIMCGVCMVMLATPVGSMTAMLAQEYDGDYELASKGVALTTLLSVVTMPLVSMLVG